jgi:hypothetical protein
VLKAIARLLPLLLVFHFYPTRAEAQQLGGPSSLNLGDAVVTGFSGTVAPDPAKSLPAGKSAVDLTFINPNGPSARIIGIGQPGFVWDGRLFAAPETFDVFAKDVGQVFGLALDDQTAPNIYLAATSAFGLQIVGPGSGGLPERRKVGGPGTIWMKGQFGLDLQGDPGSIYKVDGKTGVVSLFAKVMLNAVPNPGPALGNLAYDAAHKQLFASDLYTGMVHRFAIADGSEPGPPYDHGVAGRNAANLAPVPFNPGNRPNIAISKFDAENPDTWGLAPPERRVWGLAVHDGRLFYSARNGAATDGPQIWSVGVQQDGSFAADARWELDVSAQPGPYAVSDIAFSQSGAMILAQRAPIAASYDYSAFTKAGEPRVLRYSPQSSGGPDGSRWLAAADEYAVGFANDDRNTDGGVDLGYGYDHDGHIDTTSCDSSIWITGENLRNDPALSDRLLPGGPLVVHGIQGSDASAVRDANTPPWASYFVAYDDKFTDPRATGHVGVVRINRVACGGPVVVSGQPPGLSAGPGGGGGGVCVCPAPLVAGASPGQCVCPQGTVLRGRECVRETCPPPLVAGPTPGVCLCQRRGAACECPPPLVAGPTPGECVWPQAAQSLACVARTCPPPLVMNPDTGQCGCPQGTVLEGKECVPIRKQCPPPQILNADGICVCPPPMIQGPVPGVCVCPEGTVLEGKQCVPVRKQCPPPLVMNPATGQCGCPPGTVLEGKECVPRNVRPIVCKPPLIPNAAGKACVCPPGTVQRGNACVPTERNVRPEFGPGGFPGRGQFPGRGGEPGGGGAAPGGGGRR